MPGDLTVDERDPGAEGVGDDEERRRIVGQMIGYRSESYVKRKSAAQYTRSRSSLGRNVSMCSPCHARVSSERY